MNENCETSFPQTHQDLSNLKKTTVDAARDIGSVASVHAKTAQGQLRELATHAQEEGNERLNRAKVSLADLGDTARDYVAARPLTTVGTALIIGFLFGLSRRGSR